MNDPTTVQGDLAADVVSIRKHRTLGPIYAVGTDVELAAALAELDSVDLTVLRIHFGLGRHAGSNAEVKAAVPSVTDVRKAYQTAGNRLSELLKVRVEQRLKAEPHHLEDFEFTVRAMLVNAGILSIPETGTFTADQSDHLLTHQPWTRGKTTSFNESMAARGDRRTLEELVHPNVLQYSFVRNRVRV